MQRYTSKPKRSAYLDKGFSLFASRFSLQSGQAVMTTVLFVLFISIAAIGAFSSVALTETRVSRATLNAEQTYYLSEAGTEDLTYRIIHAKKYSNPEVITLNGTSATTTVTVIGAAQQIVSRGSVASGTRVIQSTIQAGVTGNFPYGIQVGQGGISMENNSQIIGNVYSNGSIIGHNAPVITGDAFAAGSSAIDSMTIQGDARAYLISNSTVGRNATSSADISDSTVGRHAYANRILNSTIENNAYYQTSLSGSTVGGTTYPGTPAPAQLPTLAMPLSDTTLDAWEADAAAGGIISSPCPYKPADGSVLGPQKIACDVEIDGTKTVTLAGTLWISGNLSLENTATLKLASSFGGSSGVVIVDNPSNRTTSSTAKIGNSAQILGSGTNGSYILVSSRNASAEQGGNTSAIEVKNSSSAPMYYAPHGLITIQNTSMLKEATAYKLEIKNSATVTYETGLLNIHFSTGPTGGYSIQSWKETD